MRDRMRSSASSTEITPPLYRTVPRPPTSARGDAAVLPFGLSAAGEAGP